MFGWDGFRFTAFASKEQELDEQATQSHCRRPSSTIGVFDRKVDGIFGTGIAIRRVDLDFIVVVVADVAVRLLPVVLVAHHGVRRLPVATVMLEGKLTVFEAMDTARAYTEMFRVYEES